MTSQSPQSQQSTLSPAEGQNQVLPTDRELLQRFARDQDQAAFTLLVQRHSPLVRRICQRVLHHYHDAEDVSQAAFMVLARKAASTHWRQSVGTYLFKVVYRLANKAKISSQRRLSHESQAEPQPPTDPWAEISLRDADAALHEEIARLPEALRLPVVLYYLEERTRAETAQQVGCSIKTLQRRLDRTRELLRTRLTRRGMALSPLLLIYVLEKGAARTPAPWIDATAQAAVKFAAGRSVEGAASRAAILAERGLKAMFLAKVKVAALVLLAGFLGLAAGGLAVRQVLFRNAPDPLSVIASWKQDHQKQPGKDGSESDKSLVDAYGDPLPPGALARLGTVRFRHGDIGASIAFTPDDKCLLIASEGCCHLLDAASGKEVRRFGEHLPHCRLDYRAQLSPNGRLVAARVFDGREQKGWVYFWETATGKLVRRFADCRTAGEHLCCAFSPNSKAAVAQCGDHLVLWDIDTGRKIWASPDPDSDKEYALLGKDDDGEEVSQRERTDKFVAFSPNAKIIASSVLASEKEKGGIQLWDTRTGRKLKKLERPWQVTGGLAFSPDSARLLVSYTKLWTSAEGPKHKAGDVCEFICLLDVASDKDLRHIEGPEGYTPSTPILSPDGKLIAAYLHTVKRPWTISLWNADTGKELRCFQMAPSDAGADYAFSSTGKILASLSGGVVRYWDAASGEIAPLPRFQGHDKSVAFVTFTDNGRRIISAAPAYMGGGAIHVWDARTGRQESILRFGKEVLGASSTGRLAVVLDASPADEKANRTPERVARPIETLRLLNLATGREAARLEKSPGLSFTPAWGGRPMFSLDDKILAAYCWTASGENRIFRWDVATGKQLGPSLPWRRPTFRDHGPPWWPNLVFFPDETLVEVSKEGDQVDFWDVVGKTKFACIPVEEDRIFYPRTATVSPNGEMLAIGSASAAASANNYAVYLFPINRSKAAEDRLAAPRIITYPENNFVTSLIFSPDSRVLAAARYHSGIVRIWETATGKERAFFQGHVGMVWSLAFAPDGRRLASGSRDTTVLVWDVTGRLAGDKLRPAPLSEHAMKHLWSDLADADAARAARAIWTLAAAGDAAASFMATRLHPVKAIAAETITQMIADLDANDFADRQQTKQKLAALGKLVEAELAKALNEKSSAERRLALRQILKETGKRGFLSTGEELRELRAIEALEQIGTDAARRLLVVLAGGAAGVRPTEEAKASLGRLAGRRRD